MTRWARTRPNGWDNWIFLKHVLAYFKDIYTDYQWERERPEREARASVARKTGSAMRNNGRQKSAKRKKKDVSKRQRLLKIDLRPVACFLG